MERGASGSGVVDEPVLKALLFTYDGRLNRGAFWKGHFIVLGLWIGALAMCGLLALLFPANTDTTGKLSLTVVLFVAIFGLCIGSIVAMAWAGICLGIKRYHDHDKPGVWVCIQFVPVIGGVWYFIEAFCLDGTHGPNMFGSDPLVRMPYVPYAPPAASSPGLDGGPRLPSQAAHAPRPPSGRPGWVLPVMFALLVPAAIALAVGLVMTARSTMWLNRAIHVEGTVTALKPGAKNDAGHTQYYPIVEATTADGKSIRVEDGWSTYPPAEIGSKMDLAFPPARPEEAKIVSFVDFWLIPTILDSFAVVVVGWLLVILIVKLAWKRARQATHFVPPVTST